MSGKPDNDCFRRNLSDSRLKGQEFHTSLKLQTLKALCVQAVYAIK